MTANDQRSAALDALARLWEDGRSFMARPDGRTRMADVGVRRWRSFERRHKPRRWTRGDRIEDLAKGLRDAFEPDRHLVGPLMEDYRFVAEVIADAIGPPPSPPRPHLPPSSS